MTNIVVFDFFSHSFMHLPFNEAYLRTLCSNIAQESSLYFFAHANHADNISVATKDLPTVSTGPLERMVDSEETSLYRPSAGKRAARKAITFVNTKIDELSAKVVAFSGFNSFLLKDVAICAQNNKGIVFHLILHNDLAANFDWRSKNPWIRYHDLISTLGKTLPDNVKIVALELGIKEAIIEKFPHLESNVITMEHPILATECFPSKKTEISEVINIAFVGHCSKNKGFDTFLELADRFAGASICFHAIGLMERGQEQAQLRSLATKPSKSSVPRDKYIDLIQKADLICLPVSNTYDYVASGSVLDAVTALKPLLLTTNRSYEAMFNKYGEVGMLFKNREKMLSEFEQSLESVRQHYSKWVENLEAIRKARIAENIEYKID
ncbi:glycosyltransferase [Aestuariibacter salexigens]|uniref:glycosyltransferase n=1 Tax=Aestuariibacter salexigens TaxID=226010 RepID=UPI00040D2FF6|nr:glycosyltransferase [Aestuariibacter salexigens]